MCWNSGDDDNVILVIITGLSEQGSTSHSFTLLLYPVSHLSLWHIHHFSRSVTNTPGPAPAAVVLWVSALLLLGCDMAVTLLAVSQEGCDMAPVSPAHSHGAATISCGISANHW